MNKIIPTSFAISIFCFACHQPIDNKLTEVASNIGIHESTEQIYHYSIDGKWLYRGECSVDQPHFRENCQKNLRKVLADSLFAALRQESGESMPKLQMEQEATLVKLASIQLKQTEYIPGENTNSETHELRKKISSQEFIVGETRFFLDAIQKDISAILRENEEGLAEQLLVLRSKERATFELLSSQRQKLFALRSELLSKYSIDEETYLELDRQRESLFEKFTILQSKVEAATIEDRYISDLRSKLQDNYVFEVMEKQNFFENIKPLLLRMYRLFETMASEGGDFLLNINNISVLQKLFIPTERTYGVTKIKNSFFVKTKESSERYEMSPSGRLSRKETTPRIRKGVFVEIKGQGFWMSLGVEENAGVKSSYISVDEVSGVGELTRKYKEVFEVSPTSRSPLCISYAKGLLMVGQGSRNYSNTDSNSTYVFEVRDSGNIEKIDRLDHENSTLMNCVWDGTLLHQVRYFYKSPNETLSALVTSRFSKETGFVAAGNAEISSYQFVAEKMTVVHNRLYLQDRDMILIMTNMSGGHPKLVSKVLPMENVADTYFFAEDGLMLTDDGIHHLDLSNIRNPQTRKIFEFGDRSSRRGEFALIGSSLVVVLNEKIWVLQ